MRVTRTFASHLAHTTAGLVPMAPPPVISKRIVPQPVRESRYDRGTSTSEVVTGIQWPADVGAVG